MWEALLGIWLFFKVLGIALVILLIVVLLVLVVISRLKGGNNDKT